MPLYLPVKFNPTATIAVCDRCKKKMYLSELRADGNSPGLRVCKKCWDVKDPWRLPARQTEKIEVRHPRMDEPLVAPLDYAVAGSAIAGWAVTGVNFIGAE